MGADDIVLERLRYLRGEWATSTSMPGLLWHTWRGESEVRLALMGRTEERFKHRKGPTIRHGGRVGANSILLPGIVVGQEAYVAAGSVVTKDVPNCRLVMGMPARVVRDVPEEFVENQ